MCDVLGGRNLIRLFRGNRRGGETSLPRHLMKERCLPRRKKVERTNVRRCRGNRGRRKKTSNGRQDGCKKEKPAWKRARKKDGDGSSEERGGSVIVGNSERKKEGNKRQKPQGGEGHRRRATVRCRLQRDRRTQRGENARREVFKAARIIYQKIERDGGRPRLAGLNVLPNKKRGTAKRKQRKTSEVTARGFHGPREEGGEKFLQEKSN